MNEETRRIKKAIAKLERRIKAKKPVPEREATWELRHTLLVARLERLQEEAAP